MARDRRDIATKDGTADAESVSSAAPNPCPSAPLADSSDKTLAGDRQAAQYEEQLLAFVRALARDAARADHAAKHCDH